jgi:hypothetical protein
MEHGRAVNEDWNFPFGMMTEKLSRWVSEIFFQDRIGEVFFLEDHSDPDSERAPAKGMQMEFGHDIEYFVDGRIRSGAYECLVSL